MNHHNSHQSDPRISERKKAGPHLTAHEHVGFNGSLAVLITNAVSTMWCAYAFATIALISLPTALGRRHGGYHFLGRPDFPTIGPALRHYDRTKSICLSLK